MADDDERLEAEIEAVEARAWTLLNRKPWEGRHDLDAERIAEKEISARIRACLAAREVAKKARERADEKGAGSALRRFFSDAERQALEAAEREAERAEEAARDAEITTGDRLGIRERARLTATKRREERTAWEERPEVLHARKALELLTEIRATMYETGDPEEARIARRRTLAEAARLVKDRREEQARMAAAVKADVAGLFNDDDDEGGEEGGGAAAPPPGPGKP